jgi:hypothetical protein
MFFVKNVYVRKKFVKKRFLLKKRATENSSFLNKAIFTKKSQLFFLEIFFSKSKSVRMRPDVSITVLF